MSFFSYNEINKSELFHPGCAVIKPWDVMCSSKFDFRLSLLPNLEMNPKDAPDFFWNVTFWENIWNQLPLTSERVRKVVKWWDSWQSCVRLGKSVITNIQ